jgi:hypothetical protein
MKKCFKHVLDLNDIYILCQVSYSYEYFEKTDEVRFELQLM